MKSLREELIKFIKYATKVRKRNLKSLPFGERLQKTDPLEDIEKIVAFL